MKRLLINALTTENEKTPSTVEGVLDTLYHAYFGALPEYENLDFGVGGIGMIRLIIVGILLGLAVGGFVAVYNKQVLGKFVRTLITYECLSPETGKTLPELNYADKLMIRHAVRQSVSLRRVVRCREEEEYWEKNKKRKNAKDFRVKPDDHHFYIPEEIRYMADVKFEGKGNTWRSAVAFAAGMVILAIVLLGLLPYLLLLLNDFIGMFKGV